MHELLLERKSLAPELMKKKALSASDYARKQMPVVDVMRPMQRMKDKTKSDYDKCRKELAKAMGVTDKTHPRHGKNFDPSKTNWTPDTIIDDLLKPLERQKVNTESHREAGQATIQRRKNKGLEKEKDTIL